MGFLTIILGLNPFNIRISSSEKYSVLLWKGEKITFLDYLHLLFNIFKLRSLLRYAIKIYNLDRTSQLKDTRIDLDLKNIYIRISGIDDKIYSDTSLSRKIHQKAESKSLIFTGGVTASLRGKENIRSFTFSYGGKISPI